MKLSPVFATAFACLCIASGCTPAPHLFAPSEFAELHDQRSYDYRATSAQGIVLAVRTEPNKPRANVDFWVDAIDVRLRRQGYVAEKSLSVQSDSGAIGKQIRYTRVEPDRRTYCYWVTLFASNDKLYIVEAGGDQEAFKPAEGTVEKAVLSLRN